jgi:peptide/nickel transport system ATP-binding protein
VSHAAVSPEPILRIEDLRVAFSTAEGVVQAVDGVSCAVAPGRTLGIVGESGSGKTVLSLTAMGLTRSDHTTISGRIVYRGQDLLALTPAAMRAVCGQGIAMVFQDPMSSLHPFHRVGAQLAEAVTTHGGGSRRAALARAEELLALVGLPDPRRGVRAYPHELSGGMRQRAMIAMALANEPDVLIADEPTTALDVTVQAQVLALLRRLQRELGMAIVMITHDLGVVAEMADEVAVMYAGRIVERAPAKQLFKAPEHPYTWGLLQSMPRLDGPRRRLLDAIPGRPPNLANPPSGCRFHPRCPHARDAHAHMEPALEPVAGDPAHAVACLLDGAERRRLWEATR